MHTHRNTDPIAKILKDKRILFSTAFPHPRVLILAIAFSLFLSLSLSLCVSLSLSLCLSVSLSMFHTWTSVIAVTSNAVNAYTLKRTATHRNTLQHTATHCNTLQHAATHCNTLQHTATHCNTLQHTATHCNTPQHTATHCNTLQHTATHCNTLQEVQHTKYHQLCHIGVAVTLCHGKRSHTLQYSTATHRISRTLSH